MPDLERRISITDWIRQLKTARDPILSSLPTALMGVVYNLDCRWMPAPSELLTQVLREGKRSDQMGGESFHLPVTLLLRKRTDDDDR